MLTVEPEMDGNTVMKDANLKIQARKSYSIYSAFDNDSNKAFSKKISSVQ